MTWRTPLLAAGLLGLAALAACDNGPSAVAQKDQPAAADRSSSATSSDQRSQADHRNDPVPVLDGKPMWSPSRRMSAEQSATRAFERNGEAFGTKDLKDYVRKAHAFVESPPRGAETLKRANGDTLIYDAKANVFAVANKDGAPRTMFKPDGGATYWREQKDRETRRQAAAADRETNGDDAG
jgi:pyocin large subunit-like protein